MNKKFTRKVRQSMAILSIGAGITLGAFDVEADTLPESKVYVSSSPAEKQCEEIDGFRFEVAPADGKVADTVSAELSINDACDKYLEKCPVSFSENIKRMCRTVARKFRDIDVIVASIDADPDAASVNVSMRMPDQVIVSLNFDEETLAENVAGVNVYAGDALVAANVLSLDYLHEYLRNIQG